MDADCIFRLLLSGVSGDGRVDAIAVPAMCSDRDSDFSAVDHGDFGSIFEFSPQ